MVTCRVYCRGYRRTKVGGGGSSRRQLIFFRPYQLHRFLVVRLCILDGYTDTPPTTTDRDGVLPLTSKGNNRGSTERLDHKTKLLQDRRNNRLSIQGIPCLSIIVRVAVFLPKVRYCKVFLSNMVNSAFGTILTYIFMGRGSRRGRR